MSVLDAIWHAVKMSCLATVGLMVFLVLLCAVANHIRRTW